MNRLQGRRQTAHLAIGRALLQFHRECDPVLEVDEDVASLQIAGLELHQMRQQKVFSWRSYSQQGSRAP